MPSILFLLVGNAILFWIIPRFGPLVLAIVALVLLILGVYNHYSMFATEYRLSTWQEGMKAYAPQTLIVVLVVMIIFSILYMVPSGSSIYLPSAESATNVVTRAANNGMRAAANAANVKVTATPSTNAGSNAATYGNNNSNAGPNLNMLRQMYGNNAGRNGNRY